MNGHVNKTIGDLLSLLEEYESKAVETKKMINSLREMIGENPMFHDVGIQSSKKSLRADVYYGKPLATAAREFLEWRGSACPVDEILDGLIVGGFDFEWKEKDRLRNLAINISKNTVVFHKLPNGMIGLLTWYPEATKKKADREKSQLPPGEEEIEEVVEDKNEEEQK